MMLLVFVLVFQMFLTLAHLRPFEVAGSHNRLPSPTIFSSDHGELKVVSFIHFRVFRSLADRCSRQSFFVPRLVIKRGR